MTTIVTRAGKGSALTHNEVDTNFTNLNSAKYESGNNATLGTIQGSTITATTAFSGALNGTVGATTPAAGTFTSLSDSGNLTFTGTGNRIRGDFSNGTQASRVAFQTSTTNSFTALQFLPNGTGTGSYLQTFNNSDLNNSSFANWYIDSSVVGITTGKTGTASALPFTIAVAGSERMRIDTSGNVGIGTSSVNTQTRLAISYNNAITDSRGILSVNSFNTAATNFGGSISLGGENGQVVSPYVFGSIAGRYEGSGYAGYLQLATTTSAGAVTERMRIDSSGNVGIGGTPFTKLDVYGSTTVRGLFNVNVASGASIILDSTASGYTPIQVNNGTASIAMTTNGASTELRTITNHPQLFLTNNTERMRIDSSGNVGIGTSSPAYKLDVVGPGGGAQQLTVSDGANQGAIRLSKSANLYAVAGGSDYGGLLFYSNNASERMRITSDGNVGIGTNNPGGALTVARAGQAIMTLVAGSSSTEFVQSGGNDVARHVLAAGGQTPYVNSFEVLQQSGGDALILNRANNPLIFATNNTERMRIHASGGVAIGTTTDAGLGSLVVSGAISGGYNLVADGTTAIGFGADNVVRVTPNASATYTTTVPAAGAICVLSILTSGTTSRTITFGTGFKATGTLATGTVSARYFNVTFVSDGTNLIEMSRTVAIA